MYSIKFSRGHIGRHQLWEFVMPEALFHENLVQLKDANAAAASAHLGGHRGFHFFLVSLCAHWWNQIRCWLGFSYVFDLG